MASDESWDEITLISIRAEFKRKVQDKVQRWGRLEVAR